MPGERQLLEQLAKSLGKAAGTPVASSEDDRPFFERVKDFFG